MFENKIKVITGCTGGIGKALLEEFLQCGAIVSTCSRTGKIIPVKKRIRR